MTIEERQKVEDVVINLKRILQEEDLKDSRFNFKIDYGYINENGLYSLLKTDKLNSFTADCIIFFYNYWPERELFRNHIIVDLMQTTNNNKIIKVVGSGDGDVKLKLDELEPYLLKLLSEV